MKYVLRFLGGTLIGFLTGVGLNIALSHGFWDLFWSDCRDFGVFDFINRFQELGGFARFALLFPTLVGALASIYSIGMGILTSLFSAVVVGVLCFVYGFFHVISWGGILALLLFFGLFSAPVAGVIFIIFD